MEVTVAGSADLESLNRMGWYVTSVVIDPSGAVRRTTWCCPACFAKMPQGSASVH